MAEIFFYSNNNREVISEHTASKRQALESELSKIEQWITQVEKNVATLDTPASLTTTKEVTEALMAASVYQKQIVVQMVSSNPEDAIALSLAASIEAYGKQLEDINAWTEGGAAVISPALEIMFDSIVSIEPLTNCLLQDLFQLALIDMLTEPGNYPGMDELLKDPKFISCCGDIFEFTGSGGHKYPGKYYGDTSKIGESYMYIWNAISSTVTLPPDSLAYRVFQVIENNGGIDRLVNSMAPDEYYTDSEGFQIWGTNNDDKYPPLDDQATRLNPFLTLSVLANLVTHNDLDAESWELVLSGDIETIESVIYETTSGAYDDIFEYLFATDPNFHEKPEQGFDIEGNGVEPEYFFNLFQNFPPRELTEEEIEEVNRIGDQVKMLQQTLLYWLKICRDEQMAMARNI
ncbi:hypothetical protein [Vibrio parahaemolyticus]|uniref:hypothetical protein n=1 Tax=Vibrio parahaemolyticus TaxID=670 RepID=UPI00111D5A95|nr:hypothetical protein [Vibrio parahaemolyticus]MCQ9078749.1 hypothetical protein [Vibrio parahaemolyticus]MDF5344628.1 hypothetical protein [Vibrio parahaemolyticus]TOJ62537.1 hypothetical protein CGI34_23525 [Vibrio parahaemolyticus]